MSPLKKTFKFVKISLFTKILFKILFKDVHSFITKIFITSYVSMSYRHNHHRDFTEFESTVASLLLNQERITGEGKGYV